MSVAPGPTTGHPLLGFLPEIKGDRLGFMGRLAREYPEICRFRVGPRVVHLVTAPDLVQYVLKDNYRNFGKKSPAFKTLQPVLGQGLVTSEGDFWLRQRRIAQPAFHRERIAGFAELMIASAEDMLQRWGALEAGAVVDVHQEMMKLALRIVGLALMSTDVSAQSDAIGRALGVALEFALARITSVFILPSYIPTRANRQVNAAVRDLDRVVLGMIADRRSSGARSGDLLDMLMYAKDEETGESMSDRQLRDEVMTLFLAGHETSANALTWTLMLLSRSPDVARKLRACVRDALGDRRPTLADLPALAYVRQVALEGMRLYPPVWTLSRSVNADDRIGGFDIPRGSIVLVSPYFTHRSLKVWSNPEGFDPDRFLPEREEALHRFAYFPFGGGPRQCIGNNFAMLEIQLCLAMIAQRFEPELVPPSPVEPEPLITLRPRHGLRMRLKPMPAPPLQPG